MVRFGVGGAVLSPVTVVVGSSAGAWSRMGKTVATGAGHCKFAPIPEVPSPATSSGHFSARDTNLESRDGLQHVGLIDQNVSSCPAEVIRKVSKVLNGGQRRTFDRSQDLLSIGLLDEQTAAEVMQMTNEI
uniref:Uncharacterized protein n=1 Tax=Bionectria ochroleuca TaxID=29856 RepID=A0A0B7JJN3_BIOOC